ncbi:leucine-rich repeat domain-containing protein [Lachnospiraceae bacterium 46-15]
MEIRKRKMKFITALFVAMAFFMFCEAGDVKASYDGYCYQVLDDIVRITSYDGEGGNIIIPNIIEGYPVGEIEERAFYDCTSLISIEMPDSVREIGEEAFLNCTSLTSIEMSDGVTKIGKDAFCNCTSLTSIEIPNGVREIGEGAFDNCTSLTSIEIPDSVTKIEREAFRGCIGLVNIKLSNSITELCYETFSGCAGLTNIEIPDSVMEIEPYAFYNCTGLTYLSIDTVPNGIDKKAFTGCSNITYFKLGKTIVNDDSARYINSLLENEKRGGTSSYHVEIKAGTEFIGCQAFAFCERLAGITIPDSVREIGENAFTGCKKLSDVTLPINLTQISPVLFAGCSSLKSISIPSSVTEIGAWAFKGCNAMRSVTIPKSVSKIGEYAFGFSDYVDGVDSSGNPGKGHWVRDKNFIIIGYSNTAAETYAKQYGIKFQALNTKKSNKVFKYAKSSYQPTGKRTAILIQVGNTGTVFKIPDTVKSNGKTYKVTSVGKGAFQNCKKLKSVVIGKNVTSIGAKAFSGCKVLKKITIKSAKLKKVGKNAFKRIYAKAVIKAPKAKLKAYQKLLKKKGQGKKVRITR